MSRFLWTIVPQIFPQPWRSCGNCGVQRPFCCSGKFRLNANGKRLDAWLIYRCTACDNSWNLTIVDRRPTRELDAKLLAAFQVSDAALVRRYAFDIGWLGQFAKRIDQFDAVEVHKAPRGCQMTRDGWAKIELAVPAQISLRLDRFLAGELRLSRNAIATLEDNGALVAESPLNRPVRDGATIAVRLDRIDAARLLEA